jgi:hypothetical protein
VKERAGLEEEVELRAALARFSERFEKQTEGCQASPNG